MPCIAVRLLQLADCNYMKICVASLICEPMPTLPVWAGSVLCTGKQCQCIIFRRRQTIALALKKRSYPKIAKPKQDAQNESNRCFTQIVDDTGICILFQDARSRGERIHRVDNKRHRRLHLIAGGGLFGIFS